MRQTPTNPGQGWVDPGGYLQTWCSSSRLLAGQ